MILLERRPGGRLVGRMDCLEGNLFGAKGLMGKIRSALVSGVAASCLVGCTGEFPADAPKLQAAEAAYDRVLLLKTLNEIDAWHINNDTGIAGGLAAGRRASSIEAGFANLDCRPTEELKTLWSWRDGETGSLPFVWYYDFLPMEEALSEYRWLRLNPLVQWDPRCIPIFTFDGEWFAACCGEGVKEAGPIVHYFLEDEPRIAYVNLTVFLASMAEALRTGGVRWEDGAMKDDIRKMHSIHQKRNPGYDFPFYVPNGM